MGVKTIGCVRSDDLNSNVTCWWCGELIGVPNNFNPQDFNDYPFLTYLCYVILTEIIILIVTVWRLHSWPNFVQFYSCSNNIILKMADRNTGYNLLMRTLWIKQWNVFVGYLYILNFIKARKMEHMVTMFTPACFWSLT